jgi:hypothetical protein
LTFGRNHFLAECALNFRQRGLAGPGKLPGQLVSVHDLRAAFAEKPGGGGFAHAHAAGQTANLHWLKI